MAKKCEIAYPKKGTYQMETFDSTWERDHAMDLERDPSISKWTMKHGIRIPYFYKGEKHRYEPDFLIELINGDIEIHEVKNNKDIDNPQEQEKFKMARLWCSIHC